MMIDLSSNNVNHDFFADVKAESASYYDRNIQTYSQNNQNPAEFIDEFLALFHEGTGRILDLGCGPGVNSGYMHSKNFDVLGIDVSKKMIAQASRNYPNLEFRLVDMTELSFPPDSFEGILASYSIIHLPKEKIPSLFAKLATMLKGGGFLYVSVQSGKSLEGFYSHPLIPNEPLFLNIFSKEEMREILSKCGFDIISQHEKSPIGKVFNFTKLFVIAQKSP